MKVFSQHINRERYRYGFNGQEKDDEIKGSGNHYTAEFWEYDPRTVHRWNMDPEWQKYPSWTPYHINFMNPIWFSDPDGDDPCSDGGDGDGCDGANKKNKLKKGGGLFGSKDKPKIEKVTAEVLVLEGAGKDTPILKTKKPKSKETEQGFKEGTITLEGNSNRDEGDGNDRFIITAENKGSKHKGEIEVLFDEELPSEPTEPISIKFNFDKTKKIKLTVLNSRDKNKSPGGFSGVVIVTPKNSKKR